MFILVITAHGYQNIEVFKHRRRTSLSVPKSRTGWIGGSPDTEAKWFQRKQTLQNLS